MCRCGEGKPGSGKPRTQLVRALLCAAVFLALPSAASGATFVGSDFSDFNQATGTTCSLANGCGRLPDKLDGAFVETPDGVITEWSVKGMDGDMELRTYRSDNPPTADQVHATHMFSSATESPTGGAPTFPVRTFNTQIPVDGGDYIALVVADTADFATRNAGAGASLYTIDPAAPRVDSNSVGSQQELFLRVKVEPDANNNGRGDETQEIAAQQTFSSPGSSGQSNTSAAPQPDPYASIRANGPSVSIARSATASKGGVVPVKVKNPYGFPLKGKMALNPIGKLSAKKKVKPLGTKSFSLAASATKTVKVKLSRKARRRLKRKRRLKVQAVATMKGPVGKARRTKKTLTIKAAKKKKKRRRPRRRPSSGAPTRDGSYTGTAQNATRPLTFTVRDGKVTGFTTRVTTVCYLSGYGAGDPGEEDFNPSDSPTINADGTFEGRADDNDSLAKFSYKGVINSNGTASGRLTYSYNSFTTGKSCLRGSDWTAKR